MRIVYCIICFIMLLCPTFSSAGTTDYFDRLFIYQGVEKGIVYRNGSTASSDLYLKAAIGYGFDDDKVINLNLSFNKEFERVLLNPEFTLLMREFSRIKFYLTAGLDFGIRYDFETAIRTNEGAIFDLCSFLSFVLGIDTRFNVYDQFYIESLGVFSVAIRI